MAVRDMCHLWWPHRLLPLQQRHVPHSNGRCSSLGVYLAHGLQALAAACCCCLLLLAAAACFCCFAYFKFNSLRRAATISAD